MNTPDRHLLASGLPLQALLFLSVAICFNNNAAAAETGTAAAAETAAKISFYRDIRPILQANCQGCHQPAKAKGSYIMTNFKGLLSGGETEGTAVVPEHPDQSSLLKMVTPQNGEARMPKGKSPLAEAEVSLITTWIQQGAVDDTPADARKHYDTEHPPIYYRPPVVTSLDFSPDGKWLAVAGFHEVLLYEADRQVLVA
ncbi:MAG TPA: c-type cytochrome domain-containing protein, partial [Candidatus Angelobacter sp.]|nr:c-type cytochrome domain-containing protein [Candidatus Angelobacter sp.]